MATIGRPPEPVPQEFAESVIQWIASGKTLRDWARQPGNPSYGAVYDWAEKDPLFASRLARARDIGADVIADECVAIMDDGKNDYMETKYGKQVDIENVNRSKLRVWGRLELLKCWNPRKYGAKLAVDGNVTLSLADSIREARQRALEEDKTLQLGDGSAPDGLSDGRDQQ
jgi:hypothetical protein